MKKYNLLSKILFFSAFCLLSFIFLNICISSLLFIFKISVLKVTFFISLASAVLITIYMIKYNRINDNIVYYLSTLLPIMFIFIAIFFSANIYDYTWDGNTYHKASIGMLMDGWNPLYENMEDFDANSDNPIKVASESYVFGGHYARASHIFAANIGVVFKNVESGKCINILAIIMVFLFFSSVLINESKKIFIPILLSIIVVSYPTIVSQFLTNYVDVLVYLFFFLLLFVFFLFEKSTMFKNKITYLIVYFMILIISINIKFSLFVFAALYCLGYYLWYIIRMFFHKFDKCFFWKFTLTSFFALIIGFFVVGGSVYPKNYFQHKNIFYPLMGKDKVDIMTKNQPDYFKEKSPIKKFIISTFSETANIAEASGLKAKYKMPFSINKEEIFVLYGCDVRISGNGIFYSGILIISILLLVLNLCKCYKKDKILFCLIIIPLIITFILVFTLNEAWWARYFPQIHLIEIFSLFLLFDNKNNNNNNNLLIYIIAILLLINNGMVLYYSIKHSVSYTQSVQYDLYLFDNTYLPHECELNLYTELFHGALYSIKEKEKSFNINVVDQEEFIKNQNEYNTFMNNYVFWKCN